MNKIVTKNYNLLNINNKNNNAEILEKDVKPDP